MQKAVVYKIAFSDGTNYIGYTTMTLSKRLRDHATSWNANKRLQKRLRAPGFLYDVSVLHHCDSVREARDLEIQEILKATNVLNRFIPGRNGGAGALTQNYAPTALIDIFDDGKEIKQKTKSWSERKPHCVSPPKQGNYRCSVCKQVKPETEYHKDRSRWNGLHSRCKICYMKKVRETVERNKATGVQVKHKKCIRCKSKKRASEFGIRYQNADCLESICKTCRNLYARTMQKAKIKPMPKDHIPKTPDDHWKNLMQPQQEKT